MKADEIDDDGGYGWEEFMDHKELFDKELGYLENDTLTLIITVSFF